MADSSPAYCRKCLSWVSRVGTSTPAPPESTTSRGGRYPIDERTSNSSAAFAVVIVSALAVLVGMIVIAVLLRRRRIREQRLHDRVNGNTESPGDDKGANGEAGEGEEGKWSAGAVELVVMAGETTPTFLAHPVAAPVDTVVIQCPPFALTKDPSTPVQS